MTRTVRPQWIALLSLIALCFGVKSAHSQLTEADASAAWKAYNKQFLFTYTEGQKGFSMIGGESVGTGFWEDVEEIEMAEDAYDWSAKHLSQQDHAALATEINELCAGFAAHNKFAADENAWYIKNKWNDDLTWAAAAFTRAYQITGNKAWLDAAKINFEAVWSRAQATDGGLNQIQGGNNEDAPVNFGFVIAGLLLYDTTHNKTYKTQADTIYKWSVTHLYMPMAKDGACDGHPNLTCAKISDSLTGHYDYTYNYGIAINAVTREGDFAKAQRIANWLMFNFSNPNFPYAGNYNGFNVLPDWHAGGKNNAGYNGIAMRGVAFGLRFAHLNNSTLAWAQANLASAWKHRTPTNVMEENWTKDYTEEPTYAWDCSSAIAGMMGIPLPQ